MPAHHLCFAVTRFIDARRDAEEALSVLIARADDFGLPSWAADGFRSAALGDIEELVQLCRKHGKRTESNPIESSEVDVGLWLTSRAVSKLQSDATGFHTNKPTLRCSYWFLRHFSDV